MRLEDLTRWLDESEDWDYQMDDEGVLVRNERLGTLTHCTFAAVERNTLAAITAACTHGRDVEHITRVTGYFSKVSGWNKGKVGELKDRSKSTI